MGVFSSMMNSNSFDNDDITLTEEEYEAVKEELFAAMLAEDMTIKMDYNERRAFMESEEFEAITEGKKFKKNTYVRLNKEDDLTRRAGQASIVIAGQKKDRLFDLLALNRQKERKLRKLIFAKYKTQALRAAKDSQREYIKSENKAKIMKASDLNHSADTVN